MQAGCQIRGTASATGQLSVDIYSKIYNIYGERSRTITTKTDAGTYTYDNIKKHAVTTVKDFNSTSAISEMPQEMIDYTPFNKIYTERSRSIATITEPPYTLDFTYGTDQQRKKTVLTDGTNPPKTTYFVGSYEEITDGTDTYKVHYIAGGSGLAAIYVDHNGTGTLYYVYTDHLGSILTLTDASGTVVYEQNFDAWGRERNPTDWSYTANTGTKPAWLIRGFTGHEHLPEFALINMNGRCYDPVLGRMLSPDNYVQSLDYSQGLNRYSYALNNPLVFTDPSGELFVIDDLILGVIGGTVNLLTNLGNVNNVWQGLGYFGTGFVGGALVTYISPVGSAALVGAGNAALGSYINTGQVDAGAVIQGAVTSAIVGGITMGIGQALGPVAYKALSGIASPVLRQSITQGVVGTGVGSVGGGISAAMSGGDFWQGAGQGALWGAGIGLATGAYTGYRYARARDLNPWTGKSTLPDPVPLRSAEISPGTYKRGQIRSNVSGDYDVALQEWNNIQRQYGIKPTQGVPAGFETTFPSGYRVTGQFYQGGTTNPSGYTIKINTYPPPTINKIPPIYIRYR